MIKYQKKVMTMADVLIVDDDEQIQKMLSIYAIHLAHQAMSAGI